MACTTSCGHHWLSIHWSALCTHMRPCLLKATYLMLNVPVPSWLQSLLSSDRSIRRQIASSTILVGRVKINELVSTHFHLLFHVVYAIFSDPQPIHLYMYVYFLLIRSNGYIPSKSPNLAQTDLSVPVVARAFSKEVSSAPLRRRGLMAISSME